MRIIMPALDLMPYLGSVTSSTTIDRSVGYELLCLYRKRRRPFFMIDSSVSALDVVFNKVCVLVTVAFVLTLVPGFRRAGRSLLSVRDRGVLCCRRVTGVLRCLSSWSLGWLKKLPLVEPAGSIIASLRSAQLGCWRARV